jgi:hypothetical protein
LSHPLASRRWRALLSPLPNHDDATAHELEDEPDVNEGIVARFAEANEDEQEPHVKEDEPPEPLLNAPEDEQAREDRGEHIPIPPVKQPGHARCP